MSSVTRPICVLLVSIVGGWILYLFLLLLFTFARAWIGPDWVRWYHDRDSSE